MGRRQTSRVCFVEGLTIEGMETTYGFAADGVVLVHAVFTAFVVAGGLLLWRIPCVVWVHLPALTWGVAIEWSGAVCPLTYLEQWIRAQGSLEVYPGDFVARYIMPVLYPTGLTREVQLLLGTGLLVFNVIVYATWWRSGRRSRRKH